MTNATLDSDRLAAAPGEAGDDQAAQLRQIVRAMSASGASRNSRSGRPSAQHSELSEQASRAQISSRTTRIIAVASGKGGVGKTNISVNLCCALAQEKHRVVLLDGDLGLADADVICGINAQFHLGHVLKGQRRLPEVLTATPGGFSLLAGGSGLTGLDTLQSDRYLDLVRGACMLEQQSDVLVIDCGAGIGRIVLSMLAAADLGIIVTTPEPTAITDAYALIKCARVHGSETGQTPSLSLLVNQVADHAEAVRTHQRIAGVTERFLRFRIDLLGAIRSDPALRLAVIARRPVLLASPQCMAAQDIRGLSGSICQRFGLNDPEVGATRSRMRRLLRMLRSASREA